MQIITFRTHLMNNSVVKIKLEGRWGFREEGEMGDRH